MGSKLFVAGTVVVALALAASLALVDMDRDLADQSSATGRVLGVTSFRGILQTKKAVKSGAIALAVVVSSGGNKLSVITVNTTAATKFTDKRGAAIATASLAPGHALEITGVKQRAGFTATLVKDQSYALNKSKIEISKNTALGDGTVAVPTGRLRDARAKVASFIITAPGSDDALVASVVLRDASAACGARYVDNIVLKGYGGEQLGAAAVSTTCPVYTFSFSPAVLIRAGTQYAVDVLADLGAVTPSPVAFFSVERVNAVSSATGNDMSVKNLGLTLQTGYIAGGAALIVQTESDSPAASNYLLGASDQVIAKFRLSAGQSEAVNVKQLTASFLTAASGAGDAIKNIRLFDVTDPAAEKQIGPAAAALSDTVAGASSTLSGYKHATFYPDDLSLAAGAAKTLALKVDFASYEGNFSATGQTVTPVVLSTINSAGPIVASGAVSGAAVALSVVNRGVPAGGASGSYGSAAALYRAKLTVAWIPDTPAGASSPAERQLVGKILITNLANAGLYMAQIKYLNAELISTFSTASDSRFLSVYKDSLSTSPLGQVNWSAAPGTPQITSFTDGAMTNVDIAAGASKTLFITLDTADAPAGASLSIRLPAGGVHWSDGITEDIAATGYDLPLIYRTMNY